MYAPQSGDIACSILIVKSLYPPMRLFYCTM